MKLFRLLSLGLLCLGILSTNVQADILVSYGFDDDGPTTEFAQLTGSAGNLMRGSAWTLGGGFGNSTRDLIGTNPNAAAQKIEFDYTVLGLLAGQTLDLDDITIDIRGEDSNNNAYVLNSTDITDGIVGNVRGRVNNPVGFGTTFTTFSAALDALPLQTGLENGDVIRFKFGWRDAQAGTQTYEVDNFQVRGTIVGVPEPTSAMILGLGLTGLLIRRHRR
ncbi:MAG: hypothetical protein ACI87E_004262 [Mariniblastus sp.]|jgi:hypothetical protein